MYNLEPLIDELRERRRQYKTTWWGQTCDSIDYIRKDIMEPEYKTGEWVVSRNHGSYSTDLSTNFNGFEKPEIFYEY